jgi:hypothetical protein
LVWILVLDSCLVWRAFGYLGAYGGLARKFGFEAPFTNDPKGWRKAKESYKTDAASEEATKTDDRD